MLILIISLVVLYFVFYQKSKDTYQITRRPNYDIRTGDYQDIFSAHPLNTVSSEWMDTQPRHVKLNHGGGVMYTSNRIPSNSYRVQCPPLVKNETGQSYHCWQ